MSKDETAAKKSWQEYHAAIEKYALDDIPEYQGNRREYMQAAFFAGYYEGRDRLKPLVAELEEEID